MSYCVNCGVELDPSLTRCPLCTTPVINPNEMEPNLLPPFPYPKKRGQVDAVKRTDLALLISVVLIGTALTCGLLNLFIYRFGHWSFYVIGACAVLWIFCIPMLLYSRLSIYLSILLDALASALYIGIIAYDLPDSTWYIGLFVPVLLLALALLLAFVYTVRKICRSILSTATAFVIVCGLFCVGLELLIRRFFDARLYITWSSIVLSCCTIIAAALITVTVRSRLREAVRRRMHL